MGDQDTSLGKVTKIVFAVRLGYEDPHWYANIGYYCDDENHMAYAGNGEPDVGRLCKLDLATGEVTDVLHDPGGSVRDPQVHYDARKVLFSYRKAGSHHYHLYEINGPGRRGRLGALRGSRRTSGLFRSSGRERSLGPAHAELH
jgi:hypothetical protein